MIKERIIVELVILAVLIVAAALFYPKLSAMTVRAQMREQEKQNNIRLFGREDV